MGLPSCLVVRRNLHKSHGRCVLMPRPPSEKKGLLSSIPYQLFRSAWQAITSVVSAEYPGIRTDRIKQHSTIPLLRYKLHRSVVSCAGAICSPKVSLYSTHQHGPILQSSFMCLNHPILEDFIPTDCFEYPRYCPYTISYPSWHADVHLFPFISLHLEIPIQSSE